MLLAAMLFTCCSSDSEVKAEPAPVQNAAKTLVVYYSYTNKCHEIVTTLTSQWDESKQYVMDKELTINQVAYKLGFQYPQHFTRLFKQQVGVTPSEYRN